MDQMAIDFITLGSMFLLGLGADVLGRRTAVPRVTLLVVSGSIVFELIGPPLTAMALRRVAK